MLVVTEGEARRFPRDHEAYFFSVFGTPGDKAAWGWRLEGHHISVRFDVVGGAMTASSPAFFGSNPAEVRADVPGAAPRGTRVLGVGGRRRPRAPRLAGRGAAARRRSSCRARRATS